MQEVTSEWIETVIHSLVKYESACDTCIITIELYTYMYYVNVSRDLCWTVHVVGHSRTFVVFSHIITQSLCVHVLCVVCTCAVCETVSVIMLWLDSDKLREPLTTIGVVGSWIWVSVPCIYCSRCPEAEQLSCYPTPSLEKVNMGSVTGLTTSRVLLKSMAGTTLTRTGSDHDWREGLPKPGTGWRPRKLTHTHTLLRCSRRGLRHLVVKFSWLSSRDIPSIHQKTGLLSETTCWCSRKKCTQPFKQRHRNC